MTEKKRMQFMLKGTYTDRFLDEPDYFGNRWERSYPLEAPYPMHPKLKTRVENLIVRTVYHPSFYLTTEKGRFSFRGMSIRHKKMMYCTVYEMLGKGMPRRRAYSPGFHSVFSLRDGPGTFDILSGKVKLSDIKKEEAKVA